MTRITGDHMAEARIVEDKDSDPLMPGDKIFTPMWSSGEQRHFALAGFLDLNGEGKNDHAAVQRLITMSGGIVDCDGDKGKCTGKMTVNTNYLICGDPPSEKVQKDDMNVYSRMCGEAKRLSIPIISLDKLKEQMGYKNETQVKHFGHVNTGGQGSTPPATAHAQAADCAPRARRESRERSAFCTTRRHAVPATGQGGYPTPGWAAWAERRRRRALRQRQGPRRSSFLPGGRLLSLLLPQLGKQALAELLQTRRPQPQRSSQTGRFEPLRLQEQPRPGSSAAMHGPAATATNGPTTAAPAPGTS